MLTLDSGSNTQIASDARGIPLLIELDFTTGTLYYTTWGDNITTAGHTYIGIGDLVGIQGLSESDDFAARSLTFVLSGANSAIIAAATGASNTYRRKRARIYAIVTNGTYQAAGARVQRWEGYMDQVSIERSDPATVTDDMGSAKVMLKCTRAGVPMSRRSVGLRSTHQQQISVYPTDRGLEYQQGLVEVPVMWLSKRFQQI
jgi:hypothetical protein